jgi:hypothetical protein
MKARIILTITIRPFLRLSDALERDPPPLQPKRKSANKEDDERDSEHVTNKIKHCISPAFVPDEQNAVGAQREWCITRGWDRFTLTAGHKGQQANE